MVGSKKTVAYLQEVESGFMRLAHGQPLDFHECIIILRKKKKWLLAA